MPAEHSGKGLHLAMTGEPRGFSQVTAGFSSYDGEFRMFPGGSDGKESSCSAGELGSILAWEDPLEEGMATHASVLAWRTPRTEEPGGLPSMGLQRVGHDRVTNTFTSLIIK